MNRILVDTGAWYALADRRDPDHRPVLEAFQDHRRYLLTSNYILDETVTLVRFRLGWNVAHRFGEELRAGALAAVQRVSPRDEEAAWAIFSKYADKSFSFTDCTSFALCERLKIRSCLAIDNDFRAYGLHCVP